MRFEFTQPIPTVLPLIQRIIKFWSVFLLLVIPISLMCGFAMKWSCERSKNQEESANSRSLLYDSLLLHHKQLQDQLAIYELPTEPETVDLLNRFLKNLTRILPEGSSLNELRCDEKGKLYMSGEIKDLTSFQVFTEEENETYCSYESSRLNLLHNSLYGFQLVYQLTNTNFVP